MGLIRDEERTVCEALAKLGYCNPFTPERIECEHRVLGPAFVGSEDTWHKPPDDTESRPNLKRLTGQAEQAAVRLRKRIEQGESSTEEERGLYEDIVLYYLYNKYQRSLFDCILAPECAGEKGSLKDIHEPFQEDMVYFFGVPGLAFSLDEGDHIFACFCQIRRAFHHIYDKIIGGSAVSARLRASVWESIFTHDIRRYRRSLYGRMGDITTLVTGPSGTGKELVARAIGLSRYAPYDSHTHGFTVDFDACFYPISLSALSPTLIESELFGHAKGSFTGAIRDREGYLEVCPPEGTVFLDEIGELETAIQVKLLRVLQTRTFQPIGDSKPRRFPGKVVAATNRNLLAETEGGRFREDLYYRLCADIVHTPTLRDQLTESPEQLWNLLKHICTQVAGERESEPLAREVADWIEMHLGPDYPWPGNVRELEQCVRNVLIRRHYCPERAPESTFRGQLVEALCGATLSADDLVRQYCTLVYAQTGSYIEAADRLGMDRRTVKRRVDRALLKRLREESSATKGDN